MQIKPSGQMKPCCRFDFHNSEYVQGDTYLFNEFNVALTSLTSGQNSSIWQDIRNKMIAGENVAGCHKCYKEEGTAGHSMRTYENSLRNKNNQEQLEDKTLTSPKIQYLEMTFGNYCNLKCRTCNADLSSTWWEDENALVNTGKYPDRRHYPKTVNIPFNWKPDDFKDVEEIKFTGGEPMVHPDFIKLMDMLIELDVAKNIKLDIFTNCSWIPGEKYLDRLRKFKKIVLSLSIDGVGKVNEYVRHPSKWEVVDSAVDSWLKLENENRANVHIVWNPTINVYNIFQLNEMIRWWFSKNNAVNELWMESTVLLNTVMKESEIIPSGKMKLNVLHFPTYLTPELLHPDDREGIVADLRGLIQELADNSSDKLSKFLIDKLKTDVRNVIAESAIPTELKKDISANIAEYLNLVNVSVEHWYLKELKIKITKIIDILHKKFDYEATQPIKHTFVSYTKDLDKMRSESIKECIPEVYMAFKKEFDRE